MYVYLYIFLHTIYTIYIPWILWGLCDTSWCSCCRALGHFAASHFEDVPGAIGPQAIATCLQDMACRKVPLWNYHCCWYMYLSLSLYIYLYMYIYMLEVHLQYWTYNHKQILLLPWTSSPCDLLCWYQIGIPTDSNVDRLTVQWMRVWLRFNEWAHLAVLWSPKFTHRWNCLSLMDI